jgi:hypothetical protein
MVIERVELYIMVTKQKEEAIKFKTHYFKLNKFNLIRI